MEDRSSLETSDLLRAAVQRAANIRSELVQLREQAFVAAASSQSAPDSQPAAAQTQGAGTPATLALPPPGGGKPLVLPVMLLPAGDPEQMGAPSFSSLSLLTAGGGSGGLPAALLEVGAPSPGALPTGERGAAPKSSGGGGDTSLLSGGSWSIPAGHAAGLGPAAWQLGAGQPQQEGQLWTPAAALPASAAAMLPPTEGSFDAVLAALQAEADQQQHQQLVTGTAFRAADGGSLAARNSRMRGSPGARHRQAGGLNGVGSSSRSSSRQGGVAAAAHQRRCTQPLPTFDRMDAERQLRDKLIQVNAAKRFNDARQRPAASSRSDASQGIPRLPLTSLSKASSASASQPSSAAGGGELNETSQFVWDAAPIAAAPLLRSPVRGRSVSVAGSRAADEGQEGAHNFLPLVRDERRSSPLRRPSGSTAATAGSTAAPAHPQASRRQSHVSLSDLLDSSSRGTAGGTAGSAPTPNGPRHSAFSAPDAASAAAAEQRPDAAGGGAAASAAASAAELPAAGAAAVEQHAVPASTAAVLPGEAAAPPMQDTPRQPGAVGRSAAEGVGGAGEGSLMGRLLGQLASPMGKLQSPPATPQDGTAAAAAAAGAADDGADCAGPVATEASSTSASSGVASTASSGSPDQRLRSPVRSFPGLAGQQLPVEQQLPSEQHQQAERQQRAQQGVELPAGLQQQQQQQRATPSAGASGSRLATAGSASSIGRKRSTSEVALDEPPASVKKRSPEVGGRLLPRASEEWGFGGSAAAAALAAAATSPPSPVTGLVAARESRDEWKQQQDVPEQQQAQQGQQQQQQQQQQLLVHAQQTASKGQRSIGSAASPAPRRSPLADRQAEAAEQASGSRVVVPVVLQHSPNRQRRPPASPQVLAAIPAAQQEQRPTPSVAPKPDAAPATEPTSQPVQAEPDPVTAAAGAAAEEPSAAAHAASAPPARTPRPAVPPLPLHRQGERQPPGVPPLPVALAAATTAAEAEQELPSYSHWVSSPRSPPHQQPSQQPPAVPGQQRQGTPAPRQPQHRLAQGSPQLASNSVLVGRGPQVAAAAYSPAAAASLGAAVDSPQVAVSPADLPASALARRVAESAAAASPRILATPRRRLASLEPPTPRCQAAPCLRQDEHGKQLLAAAPDLAGMAGGALLDAMRQGTVVRKAWVRPNFKAGGSVRRMQLAPGSGGRAELLYPHGLFRKPLRFAVRRAVVNCLTWRPGAYIVLDTARGMLRLEPSTAAEYARWVLALNAAFLASGAGAGVEAGGSSSSDSSSGRGGDCRLQPVSSHRWSPAILFG